MKILYLDCFSGISGDMFLSALIDAGLDPGSLKKELDKLNLKGKFRINIKKVKYNSISAVQFKVSENEKERGLKEILNIINKSRLHKDIKKQAEGMFKHLHGVEKKIHGEIHHFHELGLLDTVIDIVGAISGLKLLKIDRVFSSKINTGSGFVNTHHGKMPVPCPAALELLKGMPIYSEGPPLERVTPTGALILSEFVDEFFMPIMKIKSIGYGAGTKKIKEFPNFLRIFIAETDRKPSPKVLIETNIDDMNPEIYEHVTEKLFSIGARDVYMTPVYMKKNRPGIILSCICEERVKDKIIETLFKETTSIGLRILYPERVEMERENIRIKTEFGGIDVKVSRYGPDIINISPEYESCRKAAKKNNLPLKDIYHAARIKTREVIKKT